MADAEIHSFWQWFVDHEARFRAAYDNGAVAELAALLSARVAQVADGSGWEMGPYALPAYSFVLAPGTRDRVPICRLVTDAAPELHGWRFFAGRPPKEMSSIELEIEGATVCCDAWRYRLTSYEGGEFVDLDVYFESHDAPQPGKEDATCEILVQSLVGESVALERIGYIQHHCVDAVEDVEHSTSMQFLRPHLEQVLSPTH